MELVKLPSLYIKILFKDKLVYQAHLKYKCRANYGSHAEMMGKSSVRKVTIA